MFPRSRVTMVVVSMAILTACERPAPDSSPGVTAAPVDTGDAAETTTPTVVTSASTTVPSTVSSSLPPDTTVAPTTTPPTTATATTPPATTPPSTAADRPLTAADLILAFDGVRPFVFGAGDDSIVPSLTSVLGTPVSDVAAEYPTPDEGIFVNDDEEGFVAPFGRTVCFSNGLCAEFGAGSPDALQFVGWDFAGDDAAGLATEDGITVGSSWADHTDAIVLDRGACFSVGYASADGVEVTLASSAGPFVLDDDGALGAGSPDPADVQVAGLSAGDRPVQLFADC